MSKLNFFCSVDNLNTLLAIPYPEGGKTVEITVDFIEIPFWFSFFEDAESWKLRVFKRTELYSHDQSLSINVGELTVNKASGEARGETQEQLIHQHFGHFFVSCRNLSHFVCENGLSALYASENMEDNGIMLEGEDEKLSYRFVSGKARPELMCSTIFGGMEMIRPYMDDFWERSEADTMSLEEKIEAAEGGDEYVMELLANAYLNGDEDVEADAEKAVYWFEKLAELEHSDAQFNLGLHHAKGYGVPRDFEKAAYWMKRAADNGDEDAPHLLKKYSEAAEAVKKIGDNDPQAQATLSAVLMALAGSLEQAGTGNDYALAFELAERSAAQDNGDGIWNLALCYEHGRGVERDIDKAVELYRRGSELGHAASQHSLACYYFRGDYIDKNSRKGFELCLKSAQQGYGLAMKDLGRCYQFAIGTDGNMKTAVEWYEKALEVIEDPELERKVSVFRMLGEADEHWGEDYPCEED